MSPEIIKVDVQRFLVRRNLYAALRSVQRLFVNNSIAQSRAHLWIDAICINQIKSSEKSHQVSMMGSGWMPLSGAAGKGYQAVIKLLEHLSKLILRKNLQALWLLKGLPRLADVLRSDIDTDLRVDEDRLDGTINFDDLKNTSNCLR
jgi:hypothetical protein